MQAFNKVLFIDDDIVSTNINERLLMFCGFTANFVVKRNGQQAREYLLNDSSELPDIIFVDLYMAVMSGCEFLDWFEEWSRKENIHIPVYVLSSSMSKYDYDMAYSHNITGYIVKPITVEHLNKIINQHPEKLSINLKTN